MSMHHTELSDEVYPEVDGPTRDASVGAFDLPDPASRDAALVVTVPAGAFTAQVSGVGGATGEALIEIYELP